MIFNYFRPVYPGKSDGGPAAEEVFFHVHNITTISHWHLPFFRDIFLLIFRLPPPRGKSTSGIPYIQCAQKVWVRNLHSCYQKSPQNRHSKISENRHFFGTNRHFCVKQCWKMTPLSIFITFLCDNILKNVTFYKKI